MHVWTRRWQVTLTWARREDSPWHTTRYVTTVDTPAALRDLVERARADRGCTGVAYASVRELVGEVPQCCPAGHRLHASAAALSARKDWITCSCGGHVAYTCACGAVLVDPVPDVDCVPASPGGAAPATVTT